ncbi:hypothetical protein ACVWWR_002204 [Bradyrhizobium sp. LM3.2]
MAGARSEVAGRALEQERHHTLRHCERRRSNPESLRGKTLDCFATLAMTKNYFPPPRVSRNTPCSPNRFHTHHGIRSRSGRP